MILQVFLLLRKLQQIVDRSTELVQHVLHLPLEHLLLNRLELACDALELLLNLALRSLRLLRLAFLELVCSLLHLFGKLLLPHLIV